MSLKEEINYSIWCDFIERDFIENDFQKIIKDEIIHGATSNPAIFQQAITTSGAYSQQIEMLQANHPKKIYEELVVTDIKRAAKLLKPMYDNNSNDGFISLEVDPSLCDDIQGTIDEGVRLNNQIGYDNLMIKIPATEAGYEAMKELTSLGINVNATLVFSPQQADLSAKALGEGIKSSGKDTKGVVSVFVSRFDRLLDSKLISNHIEPSCTGIINATQCYYEVIKYENANLRTLFASTGVKGDTLDVSYYIDNLIFPNTVNTAPISTFKDWAKNGKKEVSLIYTQEACEKYFKKLSKKGIDMDEVCNQLLQEGLSAFKVSFQEILDKIKL